MLFDETNPNGFCNCHPFSGQTIDLTSYTCSTYHHVPVLTAMVAISLIGCCLAWLVSQWSPRQYPLAFLPVDSACCSEVCRCAVSLVYLVTMNDAVYTPHLLHALWGCSSWCNACGQFSVFIHIQSQRTGKIPNVIRVCGAFLILLVYKLVLLGVGRPSSDKLIFLYTMYCSIAVHGCLAFLHAISAIDGSVMTRKERLYYFFMYGYNMIEITIRYTLMLRAFHIVEARFHLVVIYVMTLFTSLCYAFIMDQYRIHFIMEEEEEVDDVEKDPMRERLLLPHNYS